MVSRFGDGSDQVGLAERLVVATKDSLAWLQGASFNARPTAESLYAFVDSLWGREARRNTDLLTVESMRLPEGLHLVGVGVSKYGRFPVVMSNTPDALTQEGTVRINAHPVGTIPEAAQSLQTHLDSSGRKIPYVVVTGSYPVLSDAIDLIRYRAATIGPHHSTQVVVRGELAASNLGRELGGAPGVTFHAQGSWFARRKIEATLRECGVTPGTPIKTR